MDSFDSEPDGDFLLAMKLAADDAETDYIRRKHETEAKDFELALKLSNELNNNAISTALSNSNSKDVSKIINIGGFDERVNGSDDTRSSETRNVTITSSFTFTNGSIASLIWFSAC